MTPAVVDAPRSWYFVCRSRDLPHGRVLGPAGQCRRAVSRQQRSGDCARGTLRHMGAHLGHGKVVGDNLRCALHHWMHDPTGRCRGPNGLCLSQRVYPVEEQHGGLFVFSDTRPAFDLPRLGDSDDQRLHVVVGRPQIVRASWAGIAANAFDIAHMQAVHHRAMRQPPDVRSLSGDTIAATIRCWGGSS